MPIIIAAKLLSAGLALAYSPCVICYIQLSELNPTFWGLLGSYYVATFGVEMAEAALDSIGCAELYYDDGTLEFGWATNGLSQGIIVNFTPPTTPWTLSSIKVQASYKNDDAPFYVEIWDEDCNELFRGTYMYSDYFDAINAWAEIDIPDIEVTGDFYACVFPNDVWAGPGEPIHVLWLCADNDLPDSGRSYTGSYTTNTLGADPSDCDWMIRAWGHH